MAVDVRWATAGDATALAAGIGRALIGFLAGHCLREGIGRIDLTTEDWNEGALRFYDGLGAERHGQKIFLRLSGEALKAIAKP
ncbi:GNAT family N-acetyltransferase [Mesorhizobium sp. M6A.T.Ca.TU.002.02.2.1]|nr:GNAT family N-acetyltransferase [Mesorhizobium sp. M6A.T.Ca.TU.002.02.2.1]